MPTLTYVTSNSIKFQLAEIVCKARNITLVQSEVDIQEIQSEEGTMVALDKVKKSFELLNKPVVISDDSWIIPGLQGFPGPYMKYINQWFTIDDWLKLTQDLQDRRIILQQVVVYQSHDISKIFTSEIVGTLLTSARGASKYTHIAITSFTNGDSSLAEDGANGHAATSDQYASWHKFTDWYQENLT